MKKDNYKIQFNPATPSKSDIQKHQDFDGLMEQYGKGQSPSGKPNRKIGRILKRVALAAAAAIGLLVIGFSLKGKKDKAMANVAPYVDPPMEEAVAEDIATASVDANQGGRITFKSGTVAVIPPRAFANRAGEVVAGPVEVKIKEYHDYVDFFLSGIPMEYDSLGTTYQLESAGMIEIYAEQDGHRLDLLPEKAIDIELKSHVMVAPGSAEPKFNIYELDQDARNWAYITKNQMEFIDEEPPQKTDATPNTVEGLEEIKQKKVKAINAASIAQLAAFEKTLTLPLQPKKPEKVNTNNPTFDLKVDKLIVQNNISEEETSIQKNEADLRDFRNQYAESIWEVLPGQPVWSPAIANTKWDDYDIRTSGDDKFTVTFIKNGSKVDLQVKPVLVGKDYTKALDKFNQAFAQHSQQLAERQSKIDLKKVELEKIKTVKIATEKMEFDEKIAKLRANGLDNHASNEMIKREVLNRFTVSSFGIWNCDRPLPLFAAMLKGKFTDNSESDYDGLTAFMVDKNRNTVAKFNAHDGVSVQYNVKSDNLMWFVTKENKIAIFRPEDFKKINHKRGKHTFVMNLEEKSVSSEEDIREILNFD